MKIYLDNCSLNRPYDDQGQPVIKLEDKAKLHIQEMIKTGKLDLVTSFILWYELGQNPYPLRKRGITDFISSYSKEFINEDAGGHIKKLAERIMLSGVKVKDAYHIACAISAGCDFLITTDYRMIKYRSEHIVIINPVDFVNLLGGAEDGKY